MDPKPTQIGSDEIARQWREVLAQKIQAIKHLRKALADRARRKGVTDSFPSFPIGKIGNG